jgi:hypothetical protein
MCCGDNLDSLITSIYPGITQGAKPDKYFAECTLLLCKNDDVDDFNKNILIKFPGQQRILMSTDSVTSDDGQQYPVEYLNSLTYSGLPLARLALKPGCPLILL